MPIPLIIWAIVAGTAVLIGTTTYLNWDAIMNYFYGKRLAILGAKGTGKSTLVDFLTYGEFEDKKSGGKTSFRKTKSNVFKLNDLRFHIKEGIDITGSEDFVKDWKKNIIDSDYTFYMIDSSRVYNQDKEYITLIERHLSLIGTHYTNTNRKDKVCIICVFCDKIPDYENDSQNIVTILNAILHKAFLHVDCHRFFGSLVTEKDKEELVYNVLNTYENQKS